MILVLGATGNVGSEVVAGLRAREVDFSAAVRDIEADPRRLPAGTATRAFDFLDRSTHASAFAGVRSVILVRPPALAKVERDLRPALEAAKLAGVEHVVFLSLQGVEHNRFVPHHALERVLVELGFAYTFLRPSFFMQNLSTTHQAEIRDRDEIFVPAGEGRTSFVDVRDLAEVAVDCLCDAKHRGKAYELTGLEAPTYAEVAALLSAALGRTIRYANPSLPAFILRRHRIEHQPLGFVMVMAALYTVCRLGKAGRVTHELAQLLGRPPRSLAEFIADNRAAWERVRQPG